MNPRVRAACDLMVSEVREYAGLHDLYDGVVQDLSPAGVAAALGRLGDGPVEPDAHDEAHLAATEAGLRVSFGDLEEHRRNPLAHLTNMDLACYDREYAPAEEREAARRRHVAAWPDAVDMAVESLDRVAAPVAAALLSAARGLAAGVTDPAALAAHARLVAHIEGFASGGDPDPSLGAAGLASLMGASEGLVVDLGRLADAADRERDRLRSMLESACARLRPGVAVRAVVAELLADHPDEPEDIYAEARAQIDEATLFCASRDLLPAVALGGECRVGPAPESRQWAMAMMSWAAPHEADAPSWYYVTPPSPDWPEEEREEWLSVFSRTTLPAITVHEVMPGHYADGRMMRQVSGDVRTTLFSQAFVEGWAHYAEELYVEEGFRDGDPRFVIGVAVEALIRVTRLASALGLHSGTMSLDESVARFSADAFLRGPAARAEAERAAYDPTYGRYTWGKLEILRTRADAQARWGKRYSHRRFHEALLSLGAPPLGLIGNAVGGD